MIKILTLHQLIPYFFYNALEVHYELLLRIATYEFHLIIFKSISTGLEILQKQSLTLPHHFHKK